MVEGTRGADSSLHIKLILKGNGYEIITEGELSALLSEIDALVDFQNEILQKVVTESALLEEAEEVPTQEEVEATPTGDIPAIRPVESNPENVMMLFATPWGNTPRSMAEIIKALEVNGVYIPMSTMSGTLLSLVRRADLRRVRRGGKWSYYKIPSRE